jgi:hypothetical protein
MRAKHAASDVAMTQPVHQQPLWTSSYRRARSILEIRSADEWFLAKGDPGMYELRWFFEGSDSAAAKTWIARLDPAGKPFAEPRRHEIYLRYAPHTGIKISRGGLELKYRTDARRLSLGSDAAGKLEYWEKIEWKYAMSGSDPSIDPVFQAFSPSTLRGQRLSTMKDRVVRKFQLGREAPVAVDMNAKHDLGFLVEVTDVIVAGTSPWWSVQFELLSTGSPSDEETFRNAAEWALGHEGSPSALREENSWSYPEWLETIFAQH